MNRNVNSAVIAITAITGITVIAAFLYNRKKRNQPPSEWKSVGVVTKLHVYPLKSGRRVELKKAEFTEYGIQQEDDGKSINLRDRSFVVYGADNNEFKTARTFPKMVLIEVSVHDESHVAFDAPGMRSLYVKIPTQGQSNELVVKLHGKEEVYSLDCGTEAASWVSRYIKDEPEGLRLGFHDGSTKYTRDIAKFHPKDVEIYKNLTNKSAGIYSDLTAVLLLNQSSVDELNGRLVNKNVTVEHFRPSITIAGDISAYAEDDWEWVKIGDVIFRNVKPCTRCIMTTIDPETGVLNKDLEPLTTLRKYRLLTDPIQFANDPKSPVMGINLETTKKGIIEINDIVYVA